MNTNNYGFIISRHVNSRTTNKYWNHAVKLIRTFYPLKKIIIIDDNSNHNFLKAEFNYKNVTVIQSEFPGRGELLPYYYYIRHKFFENAVIIHDSVFFHKRIPFEKLKNINVLPLWYFHKDNENKQNTLDIAEYLHNSYSIKNDLSAPLFSFNNKWYGCFGVQSYINHNFLLHLENKYRITNLVHVVKSRPDRSCLERIFGYLFYNECPGIYKLKSLFGNIFEYPNCFTYSYDKYIYDSKIGKIPKLVIKVWTGR